LLPVNRFCAMDFHLTPSGPEGSSGKWLVHEIQVICWLGLFFSKHCCASLCCDILPT